MCQIAPRDARVCRLGAFPISQHFATRAEAPGRSYGGSSRWSWHWGLRRADLIVPSSPFHKLPKPFLGEVARERVLSHDEIRTVFEAIGREPRITAATYEGWTRWASVGRSPKRRETWAERRARLGAEGRDLVAEHRKRQAARRQERAAASHRSAR